MNQPPRARAPVSFATQGIMACPHCNTRVSGSNGRHGRSRYCSCSRCSASFPMPVLCDLSGPLPENCWEGLRVWVFGGGRTAKGFDVRQAHPDPTIACNGIWEIFDRAGLAPTVSWSADQLWLKRASRSEAYKRAVGLRAAPDYGIKIPAEVFLAPSLEVEGHWADSLAAGIRFPNNSGLSALALADALGAEEIHLVGFDLDGVSGDGITHAWVRHDHNNVLEHAREAAGLIRARVVVHGGPLKKIFS